MGSRRSETWYDAKSAKYGIPYHKQLFIFLCTAVVTLIFMDGILFTHILHDCFTGTGATLGTWATWGLPKCQRINPEWWVKSVGTQSVGTQSVGTQSFGTQSVGTQSVGTQSVGSQSVGTQTVGTQSVGTQTVGTQLVRTQSVGTQSVGT